MTDARVHLGTIVAPHGVRGAVKVKTFTADPGNLVAYGPLSDASGARAFRPRLISTGKGSAVVALSGVADRNAAEGLRGVELYVPRSALPPPEADEYYHGDLIGLTALTVAGDDLGQVLALHDFGAGPVLEIGRKGGRTAYWPFTRAVVPVVDLAAGRLTIDPPHEVEARGDGAPAAREG